MTGTVLAWHFVGDTLRDGRSIPPDGEWSVAVAQRKGMMKLLREKIQELSDGVKEASDE